ncbi:MAG TPA: D-aminoacyl-tRNA deacylase [Candidatus Kapabacteria bacterium]|nr:D-aminoacyl-tRNA deacylase [Candidatus Kapabacteria bacterium]
MRLLIQRVTRASVTVEDTIVGSIDNGLLVFLGVGHNDSEVDVEKLTDKLLKMRLFEDEAGKMNLDIAQINGSILVVSQFTLFADTRKGNRPSFIEAARPELAERLYRQFIEKLRSLLGTERVAEGQFGAMMDVELVNDGPVTIWVDNCL